MICLILFSLMTCLINYKTQPTQDNTQPEQKIENYKSFLLLKNDNLF